MSEKIRLSTPLTADKARNLTAGDMVLISGIIYSARDAAHKRMVEAVGRGERLPVDFSDQIIYYAGPSPAKPGQAVGSVGPTTSGRMDVYTPLLLGQGLRGMIGKGDRSPAVIEAMKKHGAVYFAATGGAAALIAKAVIKYEVVAYDDLGAEALAVYTVRDFPAIVVIDSSGRNFYDEGQRQYRRL